MIELEQIKQLEKRTEDNPEGLAFYSAQCCWWTHRPTDLGRTMIPPQIPCCPHCGSVLYQADAEKFIQSAEDNPAHYGPHGLKAFAAAHHINGQKCKRSWTDYKVED